MTPSQLLLVGMSNDNILFIDRVRKKNKLPWWKSIFTLYYYYEDESISLKEKIYTFHYNMERTGYLTNGEMKWSFRMKELDWDTYKSIEDQFKKDYIEYLKSVDPPTY